jgi:hypothetical protein
MKQNIVRDSDAMDIREKSTKAQWLDSKPEIFIEVIIISPCRMCCLPIIVTVSLLRKTYE